MLGGCTKAPSCYLKLPRATVSATPQQSAPQVFCFKCSVCTVSWDTISCSPGWSQTCYVARVSLELLSLLPPCVCYHPWLAGFFCYFDALFWNGLVITLSGLELVDQAALNLWHSSCLCLLSAGIMDVWPQAQLHEDYFFSVLRIEPRNFMYEERTVPLSHIPKVRTLNT